jgi:hypothetical protein
MAGDDDKHPDGGVHAYSTQVTYDTDTGYHTDGYSVVIKPDQLEASIAKFKQGLANQNAEQLTASVLDALVDAAAFGQIPHAISAYGELRQFVENHAGAMRQMGISVTDFVARVQAAADLGYQADPVTKAQAARAAGHMRME